MKLCWVGLHFYHFSFNGQHFLTILFSTIVGLILFQQRVASLLILSAFSYINHFPPLVFLLSHFSLPKFRIDSQLKKWISVVIIRKTFLNLNTSTWARYTLWSAAQLHLFSIQHWRIHYLNASFHKIFFKHPLNCINCSLQVQPFYWVAKFFLKDFSNQLHSIQAISSLCMQSDVCCCPLHNCSCNRFAFSSARFSLFLSLINDHLQAVNLTAWASDLSKFDYTVSF